MTDDPFREMHRAVQSLRLELPGAVWEDVNARWRRCLEARAELVAAKDGAYRERDELVALLSKLYPSHLAEHDPDDRDWDPAWQTIVCIHTPWGQATWHIRWGTEAHLFDHLDPVNVYSDWDGHSTDEKYDRLQKATP